jgi:hypothetical protein
MARSSANASTSPLDDHLALEPAPVADAVRASGQGVQAGLDGPRRTQRGVPGFARRVGRIRRDEAVATVAIGCASESCRSRC